MTKKTKKIVVIAVIVIAAIIASKFVPGLKGLWPAKATEVVAPEVIDTTPVE